MEANETNETEQIEAPKRLFRSSTDRVLGGVCGGLGTYLGIDPVICRVVAVVLVFFGGAGILLYGAAWLLVPSDDHPEGPDRGRMATIAGAAALVLAAIVLFSSFGHWGWGWGWGFGLFGFLAVVGLAGLGVWWLASGGGEGTGGASASGGDTGGAAGGDASGATGGARTSRAGDVVRRAGIGLAVLAACIILAIGGAWAAAAGGGTAVAIAVIAAGAALVAGAFLGHARWLILPALALALPAGVVAAADVDVKGGVGERTYRPVVASDLRDSYRVGVGRLVVDLRDVKLPAADYHLRMKTGVGQALLIVPDDVCVSSTAHVGAGDVNVFDRNSGGVDVDWQDGRIAPPGTPRVIVDGDVGMGTFEVHHTDTPGRFATDEVGNVACAGATR